jgi:hypothetical protein
MQFFELSALCFDVETNARLESAELCHHVKVQSSKY